MTIANSILKACEGSDAFTLAGGYAVHGSKRKLFEPCNRLQEKRNKGRCTLLLAQYSDGSRLRFTYSENLGPKLIEVPQ